MSRLVRGLWLAAALVLAALLAAAAPAAIAAMLDGSERADTIAGTAAKDRIRGAG